MNIPEVAVSGSIAYDHIMSFGGSFGDHIIPEKTHVISLSFLVDSLRKQRGGVAGNVSYSLALLGASSWLIGAVGSDFEPYAEVFERLGIDLSHVLRTDDQLTASAFMMADRRDNHIASFYPGPSDQAIEIDVSAVAARARYALVGATSPAVMERHAEVFAGGDARLIYDPAFQIVLLTPEQLVKGISGAWAVVSNDYEFAMIERKTGLSIAAISNMVDLVVVTYGEQGSEFIARDRTVRVPSAGVASVVDPTGAGDAFRSGMIRGLMLGLDLEIAGRMAGLAAAYAIEHVGTQEHRYSRPEFIDRFDRSFPDCAGALSLELLECEPAMTQLA